MAKFLPSLVPEHLLRGQLAEDIEVHIEVAAPEAPHPAPDLGGEAGTGDAVEDPGNRPPRQPVLTAVQGDEGADVCPCPTQTPCHLQQTRLSTYMYRIIIHFVFPQTAVLFTGERSRSVSVISAL